MYEEISGRGKKREVRPHHWQREILTEQDEPPHPCSDGPIRESCSGRK
jgi:hypothetical protein